MNRLNLIKSKLRSQDTMNTFSWLETKRDKKYRLTNRKYYRGFRLNDFTIKEGNCVLINVGVPSSDNSFEIARIIECYDSNTEPNIKGYAKVQWYTPIDKVRKAHMKFVPQKLPPFDGDREVVRDMWSYEVEVDVETIASLCSIVEVPASTDPDLIERPKGAVGPFYICRFSYIRKKPWLDPLCERNLYSSDESAEARNILQTIENCSTMSPISKEATNSRKKEGVKRKLLDSVEDQENICVKRSKNKNCPTKRSLSYTNELRTDEAENAARDISDLNSPPKSSASKDIDSIKSIGQCRGLKSLEIVDLLSDEDSTGQSPRKIKNATSKCSEKKRREKTSLTITTYESPRKKLMVSPKNSDDSEESQNATANDFSSSPAKCTRRKANLTPKIKEYVVSKVKNNEEEKGSRFSPRKCKNMTTERIQKLVTVKERIRKEDSAIQEESSKPSGRNSASKRSSKSCKISRERPLVMGRHEPLLEICSDFEKARTQLHVSAVPPFLPCREDEFHQIFSFVEGKLLDSTGGCMYVSGVPGTGKTATVRDVVRVLSECEKDGTLPSFEFLEINAMKLTKPHQLWVQIWEGLTNERVTADHAYSLLSKMLSRSSGPKRKSIFLLLDELDLLWTRKQDVMYNLFDLSTRIDSRLIVVTIANTMDLPERMMISRVSSRLGLTRMTFQPYTFKQLEEIIQSRLSGLNVFDPDAVQLVSRKVAAVSGDARRALDICRRATELTESKLSDASINSPSKKSHLVGMSHVSEAINEMFSSPKIMAIRRCSEMEKFMLQSILQEFNRTGIEEAVLSRVWEHLQAICRMEGFQPPTFSDSMRLINGLSSSKILLTEHSRLDLLLRIRLNMSTDDVSYALKLPLN